MERNRPWAGLAGRYGAAGETSAWNVAFEHYYWDRLEEAYRTAVVLGAGAAASGLVGFRTIEGEWATRKRSAMHEATEWLTVEAIQDELPEDVERLQRRIVESCDRVVAKLGFDHGPSTLVTVMASEANVPWMPGRHGYCTDKYPYEKICIPNSSAHDHEDLDHVIQHEYAHVVNLNLSNGLCPLWLDEAVAMVIGGGADRRAWSALAAGRADWLSPEMLGRSFLRDREDDHERDLVWLGYQQSAVLGFFLADLKGQDSLGEVMRGYSNNTILADFIMRIRGDAPTDEALNEVYGFGTDDLFERAHVWLLEGGHA